MAVQMVTIGGIRYRVEDAIRLGLFPPPEAKTPAVKVAPAPQNKARKAPANKSK